MNLTWADRTILFVAIVFILFLYWRFWWLGGEKGAYALIQQEGSQRRVDLNKDQIIEVKGRLGISRLQVKDGAIRFIHSPCRGKYCIYSSWLSRAGEVTACLPNGILLQIPGRITYDTINF